MLGPFSQSLYSIVLDEKSDSLLPFFFRRAVFNLLLCYIYKLGIFVILL